MLLEGAWSDCEVDAGKSKTLGKKSRKPEGMPLFQEMILREKESKGANKGGKHGVKGKFYFVKWQIHAMYRWRLLQY